MERDPHQLVEGVAIACYAIGVEKAFIYIRGELAFAARRLEEAIAEATGTRLPGSERTGNRLQGGYHRFPGGRSLHLR